MKLTHNGFELEIDGQVDEISIEGNKIKVKVPQPASNFYPYVPYMPPIPQQYPWGTTCIQLGGTSNLGRLDPKVQSTFTSGFINVSENGLVSVN